MTQQPTPSDLAAAASPTNLAAAPTSATATPASEKPATTGTPAAGATGEKKLTGAQLKAQKKAEKAARRAQTKVAAPPPVATAAGPGASGADTKKQKGKDSGQTTHAASRQAARQAAQAVPAVPDKEAKKPTIPDCFSHLSMAKRIQSTQADKDVHPSVLVLGQKMSSFALSDSIQRLEATLLALRQVIESYSAPQGTSMSRHLTPHVLNPQIEYLAACRPLCFAMGNAIRRIKVVITKIEIDTPEAEAKQMLFEVIDSMLHERIIIADNVIAHNSANLIKDGDVVMTYASHRLVEISLKLARANGRQFRAVIIDDPFQLDGLTLAKRLKADGIHVTYYSDLSGLRAGLEDATIVMVGAEAMFSNGAMYARSGTADLAIATKTFGTRLYALNQSINFTDRMALDSLTYNEIDPDLNRETGIRLLFDTTRPEYIGSLITDYGETPLSTVATLRRLQEEN
ncbi:putative translation initiation factor eIF-2B subunit delta [Ceratocystis lukuohia]|uniref:Translation initiation factor eIF2B subunit delta n=1 Tax=Ceratocystis lukuohia TaxID=2019550 RepID=A0ABR4MDD9_9PEZI